MRAFTMIKFDNDLINESQGKSGLLKQSCFIFPLYYEEFNLVQ